MAGKKDPDRVYRSDQISAVNKRSTDRLSKDESKGETYINTKSKNADDRYYQQQFKTTPPATPTKKKQKESSGSSEYEFTKDSPVKKTISSIIRDLNEQKEITVNVYGNTAEEILKKAFELAIANKRIFKVQLRNVAVKVFEERMTEEPVEIKTSEPITLPEETTPTSMSTFGRIEPVVSDDEFASDVDEEEELHLSQPDFATGMDPSEKLSDTQVVSEEVVDQTTTPEFKTESVVEDTFSQKDMEPMQLSLDELDHGVPTTPSIEEKSDDETPTEFDVPTQRAEKKESHHPHHRSKKHEKKDKSK